MPNEPRLVMCECTDAFGNVESEPVVWSVDEAGTLRLEFDDGRVVRAPAEEFGMGVGRRAA